MSVTIRDVNTNEEIIIPPEGLIFGRTGGDADIQLDDNSISRRQARVSLKGGNWLVETIAVAQGQRPPRPVTLVEGQTFIVGNNEFEVVSIAEADQEEEAPPPKPAARPAAPKPGSARAPTMKTAPAANPPKKAAAPVKRAPPPEADDDDDEGADEGSAGGADDAAASKGFGAMFVAVPKGIAYYLLNVPKMLFNPMGTVRKGIDEQPAEPMGKIELIGYALPSMVATAAIGAWAFGLSRLIGAGHYFEPMSFIPIVPLIIAVIGAIIIGFVFHPVMEWIIRKLGGESDMRSRTNYFLQLQTVSIILAVPNAIGLIVGVLPIPFINLLGPLLSAAASLVLTFVMYQWIVSFNMIKWVKYVVLVGGALTLIGGIINTVRGGHGGSAEVATVDTSAADEAIEKAQAEAEKAAAGNPEALKALQEARAATALARKNGAAAAAAEEANEKAEKAEKAEKPEKVEKAEKPPRPEKVVKKEPEPEPEPTITEEPVAKAPPAPEPKASGKSAGYGEFARKRDLIEKQLAADPTMLSASKDLQEAYGEYLKDTSEIDKKYQKDIAKNSGKARLYEHLRDAELYQATGKQVDSIASKLKIR